MACLVISHSSADVERTFHEINNIKSNLRNRLNNNTVWSLKLIHSRKKYYSVFKNVPMDYKRAAKRYKGEEDKECDLKLDIDLD
jgi:hypothetical protein